MHTLFRKPETSKNKKGICDWHLMVFVFIMVSVDVIILTLYTFLEAFIDHFGVLTVPSKEKSSSISGVKMQVNEICIHQAKTKIYIHVLLSKACTHPR